MTCTPNLQHAGKICYQENPTSKKKLKRVRKQVCTGRPRDSVLPGDDLATAQSISPPLVLPWLFQHARSWDNQGNDSFSEVGHFALHYSSCAGVCTVGKSSDTNLCRYFFAAARAHPCIWGHTLRGQGFTTPPASKVAYLTPDPCPLQSQLSLLADLSLGAAHYLSPANCLSPYQKKNL